MKVVKAWGTADEMMETSIWTSIYVADFATSLDDMTKYMKDLGEILTANLPGTEVECCWLNGALYIRTVPE
jgi:hypothetical protein